jgi:hypothetical protein
MDVTYHPVPARLEVSWRTVKVTETDVDEGTMVRDVEERTICRTIPLPEGTRVSFFSRLSFFLSQDGSVFLVVRRDRSQAPSSP